MENKYLFRGICKWSKKWVYGSYAPKYMKDDNGIPVIPRVVIFDQIMDRFSDQCIPVITGTIGICTGKQDRDGVDIFEGDIGFAYCFETSPHKLKIEFDRNLFAYRVQMPLITWARHKRLGDSHNCYMQNLLVTASIHDHLLDKSCIN